MHSDIFFLYDFSVSHTVNRSISNCMCNGWLRFISSLSGKQGDFLSFKKKRKNHNNKYFQEKGGLFAYVSFVAFQVFDECEKFEITFILMIYDGECDFIFSANYHQKSEFLSLRKRCREQYTLQMHAYNDLSSICVHGLALWHP